MTEAMETSPEVQDLVAFNVGRTGLLDPGAVISRRTSSRMSGRAEGVITLRESAAACWGTCTYLDWRGFFTAGDTPGDFFSSSSGFFAPFRRPKMGILPGNCVRLSTRWNSGLSLRRLG